MDMSDGTYRKEFCDFCGRNRPEIELRTVFTIKNGIQQREHACSSCEKKARSIEAPPVMTDGGIGVDRSGWDSLDYVDVEPPMVLASAIGNYDGRCAVHYYGAAGRCTGDAEYRTNIGWSGDIEPIALCSKHAERNNRERDTENCP